VNGQLIPYFTGVLDVQMPPLNILNNLDTTSLVGSQFCVGYGGGTDAFEMIASQRMQLIAIVNDPNPTNTKSCNVTIPHYIPASERAVLIDLYNSTNGANWNDNTGWLGAVGTECSWYGVSCDATGSNVTQIYLGGNNLVGTIPSLSGLTALQTFWVGGNQLTGTIPSLSGLTALQTFYVSYNQLTGSIPSLSGLTALQHFSVGNNQLTGTIPSLSGLTALQNFYVGANQLTGAIPSLSGLTALQYFDVYNNQLTGTISSLSGLTALQEFDVDGNQLTGAIPSLSGLTALQQFVVSNNQLTGPVPATPSSLLPGYSNLCTNSLVSSGNSTIDAAWNTATGVDWLACQTAAPAPLTLSVSLTGVGSGAVTSDDSNINCGSTCSSSYDTVTTVNLIATPTQYSTFTGWGGACTGTGVCHVTMNTAKNITASFDPVPFPIVTTGVIDGIITDQTATVTVTIIVNPDDAGKIRSVFITALVPASFLPQSASRSFKAMALAAANPEALILVQLTPSGWQQVENGVLIPYATGVLSEQLAALTILDNVDTSGLIGAQFCVGYGESAEEMTSEQRMQLIAIVPDPDATSANTRSCNVRCETGVE
jgi:hypothetical protein